MAPLQGAVRLRRHSGGVAGAQPPANVWRPSGLARSARLQVERHALERPQCAVGFGDVGELEGEEARIQFAQSQVLSNHSSRFESDLELTSWLARFSIPIGRLGAEEMTDEEVLHPPLAVCASHAVAPAGNHQ